MVCRPVAPEASAKSVTQRILQVDIETFSRVDLIKAGVYRYVECPDFQVMLFGYAWGDDPAHCVDLFHGEELPTNVYDALIGTPAEFDIVWGAGSAQSYNDALPELRAFNANFERTCLAKHLGLPMRPQRWVCTSVHALTLGLPNALGKVNEVLDLAADKAKMASGRALMRYFCLPCKPTKANGYRTRNLPEHAPEKWALFKQYCARDVVSERATKQRLLPYPIPAIEQRTWELDQRINDKGVLVSRQLAINAVQIGGVYKAKLIEEAKQVTGLQNPNSVAQLKEWLEEVEDLDVSELKKLDKKTIPHLLKKVTTWAAQRALELRQEIGMASLKKYDAVLRAACLDDRVRGMAQFCGANRTWRWAGRIVQMQNLKKNDLELIDLDRQLLLKGDADTLAWFFGSISNVLAEMVRTVFIAKPGHTFVVADFSAIEGVKTAWFANEEWRLEVFRTHGMIYEMSAAMMFKVPIDSIAYLDPVTHKKKHGSNYVLRQKGKIGELACGYQGGVGALITMGALDMGIPEDDLPGIITAWREASPRIVRMWYDVNDAAKECVAKQCSVELPKYKIGFQFERGCMFIRLPSGRRLCYPKATLEYEEEFGMGVTFWGVDQKRKIWSKQRTYGGRLIENIVQASARDVLRDVMLAIDKALPDSIVFHVHDEVVLEVPIDEAPTALEQTLQLMTVTPAWAPGFPIKGAGYITPYYLKKD